MMASDAEHLFICLFEIKNKLTVTRGEVGGDSGEERGKGLHEQL